MNQHVGTPRATELMRELREIERRGYRWALDEVEAAVGGLAARTSHRGERYRGWAEAETAVLTVLAALRDKETAK